MSQFETNPYANADPVPTRSGLATGALICSLIFCCPLTTILGILLGVVALISTMGNSMKKGTGIALLAIIIGLVATAGQALVGKFFYDVGWVPVKNGPRLVLEAGEAGNWAEVRNTMYGQAATASDEEIQAFFTALSDRYGSLQTVSISATRQPAQQPGSAVQIMYYTLAFSNGTVECDTTIVFADQSTGAMIGKPSDIVIIDSTAGDLVFPAAAAPAAP